MSDIRNPYPYAPHPSPVVDDDVKSPCVNICRMNETTGYCEGCFRTIDEIAGWSQFSPDEQRGVIAALARRKASA
jgi:predicted Fe-S protein YdhL (DUF1289 family)